MKLQLPKLHLLVFNDTKASEDDSRKFIHVVNGHAIVQNGIAAIVNLRDYVKTECQIEDQHDFDELTQILSWMEGKSFDPKFWKDLTDKNFVSLHPSGLEIENVHYNKVLVYEDINTNIDNLFESLFNALTVVPVTVDRVAFSGINFDKLNGAFKKEMKVDNFILDFCGKEKSFKFQAQRQSYIFGLIPVDYNASCELTAFLEVNTFASGLKDFL